MADDSLAVLHALLHELGGVIAAALSSHPDRVQFTEIHPVLYADLARRPSVPNSLPVADKWLDAALEAGCRGPWSRLAELLADAHQYLPWLVTYTQYEPGGPVDEFRNDYAFSPLGGPVFDLPGQPPPLVAADSLIGFTLQAPHISYPEHFHEPPELYGVMSGPIGWKVGDGAWEEKRAGDVIAHQSFEEHAMRTMAQPALAWVIWPRNPHADVVMPSLLQ